MFRSPKEKSKLDVEIDQLYIALLGHRADSDEYGVIVERLLKLEKIRNERKSDSISPDVLATIAANLVGIALIIQHERLNVITSKALSFIIRPR